MKKESILYGVIGLLAGVVIASFSASYAVNNNHNGMMRMMGMDETSNSQTMDDNDMTMDQMADALKNKTGDDFDEAFLAGMIAHHQGAIDMAELVQANAKHDEVKSLALEILAAQTKEIDMMQAWQTEWGYETTQNIESHNMMDMGH